MSENNPQSLLSKSAKGVKWSMIDSFFHVFLQIAYTSVMAYLLDPVAFGIMAIASVFVDLGRHITNMGIGQAIIQKKELTENDIRASFSFSLMMGLFIYLVIYISSDYIALVYKKTELSSVLKWLGFSLLFVSLSIPSQNLLRRNMKFKEFKIISTLNFLFGYVLVGIVFAFYGFGVWSLVFSNLVSKISLTILYYIFARHSLLLTFKWAHYRPILSYGTMVSINTLAEFAYQNLSSIFIGKFAGVADVGIFSRAHMLVYLPARTITTNLTSVAFPAFSKIQDDTKRLREGYLTIISIITIIIFPVTFGMIAGATEIVVVILGPKWMETVAILQILSVTIGISMITTFSGIVCNSTARLGEKFALNLFFIITLLISFFLLMPWGLKGFAFALLASEIIRNIAYAVLMKKIIQVEYKDYVGIYVPSLIISLFVGLSIYGLKLISDLIGSPAVLTLILEMFVGGISLLIALLFLPQGSLKDRLLTLLKKMKFDKFKNPVLKKMYRLFDRN